MSAASPEARGGEGPRAPAEVIEVEILAGARKLDDFDILERVGGGCNGDILLVRCKKPGHPFRHKLYALKAVGARCPSFLPSACG